MATPGSPVETIDAGDVLVVGAGLAGLYTALKIAPRPVTVLAAAKLQTGASSAWAQGGVAAALGDYDSPEQHAADTETVGGGITDPDIVRILTAGAPERIADLLALGVPFDREKTGELVLGQEAAHSVRRIVHVKGDRAGWEIMAALVEKVKQTPEIRVIENMSAFELALTQDGRVAGVHAAPIGQDTPVLVRARATVLATGGIGQLYGTTTNPRAVRGEGLGMAARAGASLRDLEFVQFHPTAMNVGRDPAPLATEALRGEGAVLINDAGERFMTAIHPDAELAPRDIVTRGIFAQIQAGHSVFLDTREAVGAALKDRFPTVYGYCAEAGIDPATQPIPVAPAQHYHMGGIAIDAAGRTSLPGLWAVGEVGSTGAHGANRLASNSLLEAVVFGARAAEDVLASVGEGDGADAQPLSDPAGLDRSCIDVLLPSLRRIMTERVGVIRTGDTLRSAIADIAVLEAEAAYTAPFVNIAVAARAIAVGALLRTESRGAHFRSDRPEASNAWTRSQDLIMAQIDAVTAEVLDTWLAHQTPHGEPGRGAPI